MAPPFFRVPWPLPSLSAIFYSSSFTLLFVILTILLIITPADLIHQALNGRAVKQPYNVFIIIGSYALALILSTIIYVSRLYTIKRMMEDIPKRYVPIKKGDIPERVRRRITQGLGKGAILAWQSRPRGRQMPAPAPTSTAQSGGGTVVDGQSNPEASVVEISASAPSQQPVPFWGEINHPGWSSPDSVDLPFVEYSAIIAELPYLIEKKATFLAADEHQHGQHDGLSALSIPMGNTVSHNIASRKPYMSLAAYISYLTSLGYVDPKVGELFVKEYEKCRFWLSETQGVDEAEFRLLMKVFAGLLRSMDGTPYDPDAGSFDDGSRGPHSQQTNEYREESIHGGYVQGDGYATGPGSAAGTMSSVIARPRRAEVSGDDNDDQVGYDYPRRGVYHHPPQDTDYDTEYEDVNVEGNAHINGWREGVQNSLRRVFTQSTTRSQSSTEQSVRRVSMSPRSMGTGWMGVGDGSRQQEEVEMNHLQSQAEGGGRKRSSTLGSRLMGRR
ncbi:hypothetical protein DFH27DRAFT_572420 [Peziza echinospora]|nr:hypothetical protein DFH27DRAFT_572420 [Peziza echinospora]